MNKFIAAVKHAPTRAGLLAIIAGAVFVPAALFAWGPNRTTYTMEKPADHVVFNSITNNPYQGDEREFVRISDVTAGTGIGLGAKLIPGHEYRVQIYVHNNASSTLNASGVGVATGTKVQSKMPASITNSGTLAGYVYAGNANPNEVYDTADLTSDGKVDLEYVAGSAFISTHAMPNTKLADGLVTVGDVQMPLGGGVLVGSNALDGKWYGCMEYAGVVVYNFRVKGQTPTPSNPGVTIDKTVSASQVKVGQEFTYSLAVKNTGDVDLSNVVVSDTAPANISFKSATPGAIANNALSYTIPSLKVGATVTIKITAFATSYVSTSIENTACVDAPQTSTSPDACDSVTITVEKPVDNTVTVCEIKTGSVITITEAEQKAHPELYADKNSDKCKTVVVCEISSKTVKTVNKDYYNNHTSLYADKDSAPCKPGSTQPEQLPHTGVSELLLSITGVGALTASAAYYVQSRRTL